MAEAPLVTLEYQECLAILDSLALEVLLVSLGTVELMALAAQLTPQ